MIRKVEWRDMTELVENYYSYYDEVANEDPDMGLIFNHVKPDLDAEVTWFTTLYRDILADNVVALVAEEDHRVVGVCDVHRLRPGSEVSHIGVLGIAIRKGYRNRGIGTELISGVIEACRGRFEVIRLSVFVNNDRAKHLYEKLGFIEHGVLPRSIKRNDRFYDEVLMHMFL